MGTMELALECSMQEKQTVLWVLGEGMLEVLDSVLLQVMTEALDEKRYVC
jgi:hypothetical protein